MMMNNMMMTTNNGRIRMNERFTNKKMKIIMTTNADKRMSDGGGRINFRGAVIRTSS